MRLIDANKLKEKVEELQKNFKDGGLVDIGIGYASACNDCCMWIDSAETISCGLTTHGEWKVIANGSDFDGERECSICGGLAPLKWLWKYCPHCGARMGDETHAGETEEQG